MWQNLSGDSDSSVHLQEYPSADEGLVDRELSKDVDALLRLVTLGGAARNVAKVKVRQPLAELVVQSTDDGECRVVDRFQAQLCEELNIKKASVRSAIEGPLLRATAKLNKKSAAPKLGPKLKEAEAELASRPADQLAKQLRDGPVDVAGVPLDAADIVIEYQAAAGWAGVADKNTQVALDTRITLELKLEGLAREIIRFVQEARKNAGLDVADKIKLRLATESTDLGNALTAHRETIATETQVVEWLPTDAAGADSTKVKIDGQELTIAIVRV
jgi:isoleucyl-tRNA synthetase